MTKQRIKVGDIVLFKTYSGREAVGVIQTINDVKASWVRYSRGHLYIQREDILYRYLTEGQFVKMLPDLVSEM
jgi:hypothetical protein